MVNLEARSWVCKNLAVYFKRWLAEDFGSFEGCECDEMKDEMEELVDA
jgi:hypothetical protein